MIFEAELLVGRLILHVEHQAVLQEAEGQEGLLTVGRVGRQFRPSHPEAVHHLRLQTPLFQVGHDRRGIIAQGDLRLTGHLSALGLIRPLRGEEVGTAAEAVTHALLLVEGTVGSLQVFLFVAAEGTVETVFLLTLVAGLAAGAQLVD